MVACHLFGETMLFVIAALLAASSARGEELAHAPQAQIASTRSLTAVRVLAVGADEEEGGSGAPLDGAPTSVAEQGPSSSWYLLYGGRTSDCWSTRRARRRGPCRDVRPWRFLRLEGGLNWNYLSLGFAAA